MITTLATVKEYTQKAGMEPVQIDGIPEGFSYQMKSMSVSGVQHEGKFIAFIPLSDDKYVMADTKEELLNKYKAIKK